MRKRIIIAVIGMVVLWSGCSLSNRSQIEIEQDENPMIWKQVLQIQAILWPLERKVNELEKRVNDIERNANRTARNVTEAEKNLNETRDQLATTKLLTIQAQKNMESLQTELQQSKTESAQKKKTTAELPPGVKTKKETLKAGATEGAGKKAGPDIQSIIADIQHVRVDTRDNVLIYVNAMNDPKLQTLNGENPRIVLDFLNARHIARESYEINTAGNFIKKIRIRTYKEPLPKVRVVFDMMPNKKYALEQRFSKEGNMYSFDIKAK